MERFSRELFDMMVASARTMAQPPDPETSSCPCCGDELSGDVARDGREDETCGSPHCRSEWYQEIWERG